MFFSLTEILFGANITPFYLIKEVLDYTQSESIDHYGIILLFLYIILVFFIYYILLYLLIKNLLKFPKIEIKYKWYWNILIRLMPLGYIISLIHSTKNVSTIKGILLEMFYTITTVIIFTGVILYGYL